MLLPLTVTVHFAVTPLYVFAVITAVPSAFALSVTRYPERLSMLTALFELVHSRV